MRLVVGIIAGIWKSVKQLFLMKFCFRKYWIVDHDHKILIQMQKLILGFRNVEDLDREIDDWAANQ